MDRFLAELFEGEAVVEGLAGRLDGEVGVRKAGPHESIGLGSPLVGVEVYSSCPRSWVSIDCKTFRSSGFLLS